VIEVCDRSTGLVNELGDVRQLIEIDLVYFVGDGG
jgi:hypothetical protein